MNKRRFALALIVLVVMLVATIGVTYSHAAAVCSPATAITVPYTKDGVGDICVKATSLCAYVNSWNTTTVEINGTAYTNVYVAASSIAPLNGAYTIHYVSTVAWAHLEVAGTCGAPQPTNTTPPNGPTPTRTNTPPPGVTPTRTFTPVPNSSCNVSPVDPNATTQAKKLLCYIYSQYGNHIISGQQESTWVGGPDYEMNYIYNNTGKYPAIRGLDMGDSPDFGARALAWWNSGGIPMVSYHMGSPAQTVDGYAGSQLTANINAALTPGTADYGRLTQRLDGWAAQLKIIQNGNGAIILRPWHEASGTWFWWSKEGASQYNRLWIFTFNYLVNTKGIHNLVWLHPFDGQPSSSWYPGKSYVDIGGADAYAGDNGPLTSMFNSAKGVYGSTMPIALHENGPIPDPDQLQSAGAHWVLFNTWHSTWITNTSLNPISLLQKVYTSSYVVTRDEVPNLK
jgi:hypothetical protein